ncbi:BnaCnng58350D, partial [Brassica napus]
GLFDTILLIRLHLMCNGLRGFWKWFLVTPSSKISRRQRSPHVFWSKVVWFKENIPWNSFITWLALLRRLPTQDRLIRWGLTVPAECTFNLYRDASPLILRM